MPLSRGPQSKTYGLVLLVVYTVLAAALAYRGYQRHDRFMMALAAGVVLAAVLRLVRIWRSAPPANPTAQAPGWYKGPNQNP